MLCSFSTTPLLITAPSSQHEWTLLPQGMANSVTFCLEAVASALKLYLDKLLNICHYTEGIQIWGDSSTSSSKYENQLLSSLSTLGFKISPHTLQLILPISLLGRDISIALQYALLNSPFPSSKLSPSFRIFGVTLPGLVSGSPVTQALSSLSLIS